MLRRLFKEWLTILTLLILNRIWQRCKAAISLYTAALIAAKDSTKENTASKNAARLVVENLSHLKSGTKSGTKYVFKVTATSPEANKMNTYNFSNPVEKFVP